MSYLNIYIDGAAKGNPGPAGIGVLIYKDGAVIKKVAQFIGKTTNNVAEYSAFICALKEAIDINAKELKVWTDSQLLCRQIKGEYKVRHINLKPLFEEAKTLINCFSSFQIYHINREKNRDADGLANKAIKDSQK